MLISKITIKNFRGIDLLENLEVSRINTFVGKNDSGKSTILRALDCFFDNIIATDLKTGQYLIYRPHYKIENSLK